MKNIKDYIISVLAVGAMATLSGCSDEQAKNAGRFFTDLVSPWSELVEDSNVERIVKNGNWGIMSSYASKKAQDQKESGDYIAW